MSAFLMETVLVAAAATPPQVKANQSHHKSKPTKTTTSQRRQKPATNQRQRNLGLFCSQLRVLTPGLLMHVTEWRSLGPALSGEHSGLPRTSAHLGVLEDVHDEDGEAQAEDVGGKAGVEVGVGVLLQAAGKAEGRG